MRDPGLREDRRVEMQVGLLVVLALVVLVAGVFWISNTRFGGPVIRLYGVAPEAGQITADARVSFLGVDVGEVTAVNLRGLQVVLEMRIDQEIVLPADSRGFIQPAGFLGTQLVRLVPGLSDEQIASGDTIPLLGTSDLQSLAGDLGDEATLVLERVRDVLSTETVSDVRTSASAFASAMRELESLVRSERAGIRSLVDGLQQTATNLADATGGPEVEQAVARLDSLTERLTSAAAGLDSTSHSLASITARLDSGEGTLGRLLTDEALYEDLTAAVENIQFATEEVAMLSRDLRERPERYLRGLKISVF
jgi:phospholipid/cholesterol/gamma-HCH transport system substrate-binding protein